MTQASSLSAGRPRLYRRLRFALVLPLLLAGLLFTSACGSKVKDPAYLGDYNYEAPVAWLVTLRTEDGDFLEYRTVKDLYAYLTATPEPVVICVRQKTDAAAPSYIPLMEDWAYQYSGKVQFIFADAESGDPFLERLDFSHTPTFYLIKQGAILKYATWDESNALKILEETFKQEAGRTQATSAQTS